MEKYPDAKVTAIDYSDVSVAKATSYNQKMIDAGRCVVKQGDVSQLDLADVYKRGDGVNGMDALSIQKYDAGLLTALPESVQAG